MFKYLHVLYGINLFSILLCVTTAGHMGLSLQEGLLQRYAGILLHLQTLVLELLQCVIYSMR